LGLAGIFGWGDPGRRVAAGLRRLDGRVVDALPDTPGSTRQRHDYGSLWRGARGLGARDGGAWFAGSAMARDGRLRLDDSAREDGGELGLEVSEMGFDDLT
jgi:hypothetical protein